MQKESKLHEVCSEVLVAINGSMCPVWSFVPVPGLNWSIVRHPPLTFQNSLTSYLMMEESYPSETSTTTCQTASGYAVNNPTNYEQAACAAIPTASRKESLSHSLSTASYSAV
jgi:hypothetical protein